MPLSLLLIEDDPTLQTTLQRSLERRGFAVTPCGDGRSALPTWERIQPDVVALDLSLPGMDGLQVLETARSRGWQAPVLILTARGTVGDRVIGLNTGADDYLAKPFDLDELEARLRALARRQGLNRSSPDPHPPVVLGRLRWDRDSGAIHCDGQVLELPPRELTLLQALLARPGRAFTREQLSARVFPDDSDVNPDAIEVVVYRLRKRLADTGVQLSTLRGLGYLLKADA